jgi:RNA polymerase sigma factor (TIGR02999 family)
MSDVTRILSRIDEGDPQAAEQLLPLVYDELRKLATARLIQEPSGQTLEGTALVHEAYLRLVGVPEPQRWSGRGHFFAAAAEAMRRILVDNARKKRALQRGGDRRRVEIDLVEPTATRPSEDVLALHDALQKLEQKDHRKADLVKLRYFAGLTMEQAAEALGISLATAHRSWNYARAWLHQEIAGEDHISEKI